jgi:hypothetical protein
MLAADVIVILLNSFRLCASDPAERAPGGYEADDRDGTRQMWE